MTVLPVNVDDDLIELVDAQAAESGKSRAEVLAAAIRRGLGGGRMAETLSAYRTGEDISEDDAMALAKAELAAARAERTTV
ncbi:MAG: CopG family transcriptional regulator [Nocardioidaceae bacterium]|nr:MAG: CopG family transcriptional regulator [Nocardioidaceae bacterium]